MAGNRTKQGGREPDAEKRLRMKLTRGVRRGNTLESDLIDYMGARMNFRHLRAPGRVGEYSQAYSNLKRRQF